MQALILSFMLLVYSNTMYLVQIIFSYSLSKYNILWE